MPEIFILLEKPYQTPKRAILSLRKYQNVIGRQNVNDMVKMRNGCRMAIRQDRGILFTGHLVNYSTNTVNISRLAARTTAMIFQLSGYWVRLSFFFMVVWF